MLATRVDEARGLALLETSPAGVGYLLEHRVPDVERFPSASGRRVGARPGGQARDRRARLTPRELRALMAQGRSNRAIAQAAFLSGRAVERHVNRAAVLAVLAHLRAAPMGQT